MRLVECIPNFSDGRSDAVLAALVARIESAGARVLDASRDEDHNRSVVTFAAPPDVAAEAAFGAVEEAARRIDLRRHRGVHPRIGATDVCPFVPLQGASTEDCVAVAHDLGRRIGRELSIPVYFYGEAARTPGRRALPAVRKLGFEELRVRVASDPDLRPDEGPGDALHPSAGAVAVGVRPFLLAFNVNLRTRDLAVARRIASRIREANGGLPGVRALGLPLARGECVQVSTNVCDFQRAGLVDVYDAIRAAAEEEGVAVQESELVGLAPRAALDETIARHVGLRDFDAATRVVEERLALLGPGGAAT